MGLDLGEEPRRLLDAGTGRGTDVQAQLAGVHGREEVATEQRDQGDRAEAHRDEGRDERAPALQETRERPGVGLLQPLEPPLDGGMQAADRSRQVTAGLLPAEQVLLQGRNQRARQEVRREHGEDDRHRQGNEERLRGARDESDRHEDDADAQRGHEGRRRDLARAVEDRLDQRLAQAALALEVLDLDRRVVHEDADRERHPAEGHQVQRLPEQTQGDGRDQQRKRDRHQDDHGAAPAPEEHEHHQPGQAGRDGGLTDDAADGRHARRSTDRRAA